MLASADVNRDGHIYIRCLNSGVILLPANIKIQLHAAAVRTDLKHPDYMFSVFVNTNIQTETPQEPRPSGRRVGENTPAGAAQS